MEHNFGPLHPQREQNAYCRHVYIVYFVKWKRQKQFFFSHSERTREQKDNCNYRRKWTQWKRFLSTLSIYFHIKCNGLHIVPHNQSSDTFSFPTFNRMA